MNDLVDILRVEATARKRKGDDIYGLLNEAADEIEALLQTQDDKQATINRLSRRARVVR